MCSIENDVRGFRLIRFFPKNLNSLFRDRIAQIFLKFAMQMLSVNGKFKNLEISVKNS